MVECLRSGKCRIKSSAERDGSGRKASCELPRSSPAFG